MDNDELNKLIGLLNQAMQEMESIQFKSRVDRRSCNKPYKTIQKALRLATDMNEEMIVVDEQK